MHSSIILRKITIDLVRLKKRNIYLARERNRFCNISFLIFLRVSFLIEFIDSRILVVAIVFCFSRDDIAYRGREGEECFKRGLKGDIYIQ